VVNDLGDGSNSAGEGSSTEEDDTADLDLSPGARSNVDIGHCECIV
jgi:hypothetical protein